jgi:uncharacterized membrane protein
MSHSSLSSSAPSHAGTGQTRQTADAEPSDRPRRAPAEGPAPGAGSAPGAGPARAGAKVARSGALDRLRGVALVAMLVHHLVDWQTGDARAVLPGWRSFALTDAAAVAFFVAAGASMALFVAAQRRRRVGRAPIGARVLRRYGMLVPIGLALDWLLWRNLTMFGVLEVLGVTVVAGAAVAAVVPRRALPAAAVAVLVAGVASERAVAGSSSWLADEAIAGKFPLVTYVGFVLVGAAAVRTGWYASRRRVFAGAAVAVLATLAMLADGLVPARYPGDVTFVVPGLAVTIIVFALSQHRWPGVLRGVDAVVRGAAAHTLGIFLGHYLIYGALRRGGLMGGVDPIVAVPVALGATAALCLLAPRLPQFPWSLRTGRRRRPAGAPGGPPAARATAAATPAPAPATAPATAPPTAHADARG